MKRLTGSNTLQSVNRLSKLQKWVLTRAYQHYCSDNTAAVNGEEIPEHVNRLAAQIRELSLGNIMSSLGGAESNPEIDALRELPLPSHRKHILTAQIVGHILGLPAKDPGKEYAGFDSWRQNFTTQYYLWWADDAAITPSAHNSARASASRCLKRLSGRGLCYSEGDGLQLTAAGRDVAASLTGAKPKPRCWETVNYSALSETVNRLSEAA